MSAADVLNGRVPAGALRDKIVFVGTTALGTREVVATPLDTLFAGVEVQATVADNLLEQDFIRRPQLGTMLESQVVLALGIAVARAGDENGLCSGACSVAPVVSRRCGAEPCGCSRPTACSCRRCSPTLGVIPALPVMTLAKFTVERRRADTRAHGKATAQHLMVQTLLSLTEVRDAETGRHSRRTQQYARVLAEQLAAASELPRRTSRRRESICCRASRRFTTSARSAFPITSSTSPARSRLKSSRRCENIRRTAGTSFSRRSRGRRARRRHARHGEGHRLHPSRAVGRKRIPAGLRGRRFLCPGG